MPFPSLAVGNLQQVLILGTTCTPLVRGGRRGYFSSLAAFGPAADEVV